MRATTSTSLVLFLSDPSEAIDDLFGPEGTLLCSLRKRLRSNDPDVVRRVAKMTNEEQLDLARLCYMQDVEAR